MPTSTKTKTVTFYAKCVDLRLIRVARRPRYNPAGEFIGNSDGVTYEFKDGRLEVGDGLELSPGQAPNVVLADGPEGEEQDTLAWLRAHGLYQAGDFGFHELGAEPDRVPDPAGTLAEVAEAAARRDAGELHAILAAEEAGHGREAVLSSVRAAIVAVEDIRPPGGPPA